MKNSLFIDLSNHFTEDIEFSRLNGNKLLKDQSLKLIKIILENTEY